MTLVEIIEAMKKECPAEYFVSCEAVEKLLVALGEYVQNVGEVLHGEIVCDHSVGICACEYWRCYHNLQFQVKNVVGGLTMCRFCGDKFDPDTSEIGGKGRWEFHCDNCWDEVMTESGRKGVVLKSACPCPFPWCRGYPVPHTMLHAGSVEARIEFRKEHDSYQAEDLCSDNRESKPRKELQ